MNLGSFTTITIVLSTCFVQSIAAAATPLADSYNPSRHNIECKNNEAKTVIARNDGMPSDLQLSFAWATGPYSRTMNPLTTKAHLNVVNGTATGTVELSEYVLGQNLGPQPQFILDMARGTFVVLSTGRTVVNLSGLRCQLVPRLVDIGE